MRSILGSFLTIGAAYACFFSSSLLIAQQTAEASQGEVSRCARWLKATGPSAGSFDPVRFCSGQKNPEDADGWWSTHNCGQASPNSEGHAKTREHGYCASVGETEASGFMAISFASATRDGHDLLQPANGPAADNLNGAIFYTQLPLRLGDLELPSGMFKLIPFRSPDGWQVAVARLDGEWNDNRSSKALGTTRAETLPVTASSHTLAFDFGYAPHEKSCISPREGVRAHELHMMYGDVDLYACVRPALGSEAMRSRLSLPAVP